MMNQTWKIGDVLPPITIVDLTVDGRGVGKLGRQVVFLDRGIIHDKVQAQVASIQKRIIFASVQKILEASEYAVTPSCEHFSECGGCMWRQMAYPALCAWKEQRVQQTLARIGGCHSVVPHSIIPSPVLNAFRNKMAYAFGLQGQDKVLGLRKRASHEIVSVTECLMQPPKAMAILHAARESVAFSTLPVWNNGAGYLRFLLVHSPHSAFDRQFVVELITAPGTGKYSSFPPEVQAFGNFLMDRVPEITGFVHSERKSSSAVAEGERVVSSLGSPFFMENIGELAVKVSPSVFLQTNPFAAEKVYEMVRKLLNLSGKEIVWDMYCGIGTIGLFLAKDAAGIYGMERNRQAVALAKENAQILQYAHCYFYQGQDITQLTRNAPLPDVVIVDPPRAGLSESDRRFLLETTARKLVYVSCDVATQARDLAILSAKWDVSAVVPVDMFPYTPHVESIVYCIAR